MMLNNFLRASKVSIAILLDIPLRSTERWLKQLKAQGLIEFKGIPKTGGYLLYTLDLFTPLPSKLNGVAN